MVREEFIESPNLAERDIVINRDLEGSNSSLAQIHREIDQSLAGLFRKTPVMATSSFVRHNLPLEDKGNTPKPGYVFHKNLISYLTVAYDMHYSVILTPDMIFYTLLAELAAEIKAAPESFAELFTSTPDQAKRISVACPDPTLIDLDLIVQQLAKKIPTGATGSAAELFTASFSTSTWDSRLAMNAAFADAMSPYYEYHRTMCGIPRVRVMGTKHDWQSLEDKIAQWKIFFSAPSTADRCRLGSWLDRAREAIVDIYTVRDPVFWSRMFSLDRCTSGSTDVVEGWISRLYRSAFPFRKYGQRLYTTSTSFFNMETHISTVRWMDDETEKEYSLFVGLFCSRILPPEPGALDEKFPFLEAQFAHCVLPVATTPSAEEYERYLSSLPADDRHFLRRYCDFMDAPVVLEATWAGKLRQRRELVLSKFKKLAQRDKKDSVPVHLQIGWDLMNDLGLRAPLQTQIPADVEKVFDQLSVLLKTPDAVHSLELTQSETLQQFYPAILDSISGVSSLKSLTLRPRSFTESGKLAPFVEMFQKQLVQILSHPNCGIEVFECDLPPTGYSELAVALAESRAAIRELRFNPTSAPILKAVASRITHTTHPLKLVEWANLPVVTAEDAKAAEDFAASLAGAVENIKATELDILFFGSSILSEAQMTPEIKASFVSIAASLDRVFSACATLESIPIQVCGVPPLDLAIAVSLCKSTSIRTILDFPFDQRESARASQEYILRRFVSLESMAGLSASICPALAHALTNPTNRIKAVKFRYQNLNAEALLPILLAIESGAAQQLVTLELVSSVDSTVVDALCRALESKQCKVKFLNLGKNKFTSKDAIKIMQSLEVNDSVTTLSFPSRVGFELTPEDNLKIFEALGKALAKSRKIRQVLIALSALKKEDVNSFAEAIKENKKLVSFSFDDHNKREILESVRQIVTRNRKYLKRKQIRSEDHRDRLS